MMLCILGAAQCFLLGAFEPVALFRTCEVQAALI